MLAASRYLFCLAILMGALLSFAPSAQAQQQEYFSGRETGDTGTYQNVPSKNTTCVKVRDVESVGDRTCTYQCAGGESFSRTQSRTRLCEGSVSLSENELAREISGTSPKRCILRRFRATQTDRICVYTCEGETLTRSVPRTVNCSTRIEY